MILKEGYSHKENGKGLQYSGWVHHSLNLGFIYKYQNQQKHSNLQHSLNVQDNYGFSYEC
jgi:hypothetical protein